MKSKILNDYDLQKAIDEWRTSFGYVLQNSPLFSGTIRENILYGVNREVQEEELDQACRAAAYDFIHEFPEGYDTHLGRSASAHRHCESDDHESENLAHGRGDGFPRLPVQQTRLGSGRAIDARQNNHSHRARHECRNDGSFIIVYGCFGASYKEKAEGETTETYKIFESFPMDYSGNHGNLTVWDCTFEQFIDYMVQRGHFNRENAKLMTTIGTENWIYDSVDAMWWDVNNLAEGTDAANYWKEFQENGGYIMFGGSVYAPVFNGPFAIKANAGFSGNTDKLYEDFMNFPKNYTPSEG